MQLDPAGAAVETTQRLLEGIRGEIEADERQQASRGALRVFQRSVVRGSESRLPIGLVEAEHERSGEAVAREQRSELVVVADHAVDVVSEVGVGIEELS